MSSHTETARLLWMPDPALGARLVGLVPVRCKVHRPAWTKAALCDRDAIAHMFGPALEASVCLSCWDYGKPAFLLGMSFLEGPTTKPRHQPGHVRSYRVCPMCKLYQSPASYTGATTHERLATLAHTLAVLPKFLADQPFAPSHIFRPAIPIEG